MRLGALALERDVVGEGERQRDHEAMGDLDLDEARGVFRVAGEHSDGVARGDPGRQLVGRSLDRTADALDGALTAGSRLGSVPVSDAGGPLPGRTRLSSTSGDLIGATYGYTDRSRLERRR